MGILITLGIFFIFITMIFVAVAIFLPEWLGITGKKAKEIIAEQTGPEHAQAHEPGATKELPK